MIKLFRFLKPFSKIIALGVACLLGQALAELFLPRLMSDMVDNGMLKGDAAYVINAGKTMLLVAFASTSCAVLAGLFSARIALGFGRDVRNAIFSRVEDFTLSDFDRFGTASLVMRTTNDIVNVQNLLVMGFRFIIYSPIMCIGGVAMALTTDVRLAVILLVSVPLLFLSVMVIARKVMPAFKIMREKIDRLTLIMRENLTGIRVIRAFNREKYEEKRFGDANRDLTDLAIRLNKTMSFMHPIVMLVLNATSVAIIWFGGLRIAGSEMQIGEMIAFLQYAMMIMMSIMMVSMVFVMIPNAQASAVRINEALETKSGITDPETPVKPDVASVSVEFRNVSFSYPGAELPVIDGITFTAKKGETTAIIGGTGSGKTTVINLIPRFYDATGGEVFVNGINVKDMAQSDLRAKIGIVPQNPVLFTGTVRGNISFGEENAGDADIRRAADIAQATEFIEKMPDGFESELSQGGTNVSGGQKQRLSIARAIIRNPDIYIFDDSFSALDYKTDALLRAALKPETKNAAIIIVAQRVASIMDADNIIVIERGKIAGMGRHKDLLNSCAVYREICVSQLSEDEL